ncbi:hypothetical protein E4U35_002330 [Claviceps purpurea]|nr:hypothetical protein E4U35_002330 [Claviceps purpurea]
MSVIQIGQPFRRRDISDFWNPDHDACDKSHRPVLIERLTTPAVLATALPNTSLL